MAWVKGQSGNPSGRPAGHQDRFKAKFWADLHYAWNKAGADALERMIQSHPNQFIDVCARVLPKEEQRKEISHQIEITLREPEWVKLAHNTDKQTVVIEAQAIDIVDDSESEPKP